MKFAVEKKTLNVKVWKYSLYSENKLVQSWYFLFYKSAVKFNYRVIDKIRYDKKYGDFVKPNGKIEYEWITIFGNPKP